MRDTTIVLTIISNNQTRGNPQECMSCSETPPTHISLASIMSGPQMVKSSIYAASFRESLSHPSLPRGPLMPPSTQPSKMQRALKACSRTTPKAPSRSLRLSSVCTLQDSCAHCSPTCSSMTAWNFLYRHGKRLHIQPRMTSTFDMAIPTQSHETTL